MASAEPDSQTGGKDLTQTVAQHYNELKEGGIAERTKSKIFYLRNFNNWIKSMAIAHYLEKINAETGASSLTVLDLCSGKGGDLLKWKIGKIEKLVCADIAGMSVKQCEDRYNEMKDRSRNERHHSKLFDCEFITADCTKTRLRSEYKNPDIKFDMVSCQFSFHYCFESYRQADMMIRNACECLKVGGYFIGTTPNSFELFKRFKTSEGRSFINGVTTTTLVEKDASLDKLPLFGTKYDFHLEGVVDCPEFAVYFPAMEQMAKKYGMEITRCIRFDEFFEEQVTEGRGLIGRMQGLEPYPAEGDVELMSDNPMEYTHAKEKTDELKSNNDEQDRDRHRKPIKIGTLSKSEWEATTVYVLFAFKKVKDISPAFIESASTQPTDKEITEDVEAPQPTSKEPTEVPQPGSKEHTDDTETPQSGSKRSASPDGKLSDDDDDQPSSPKKLKVA